MRILDCGFRKVLDGTLLTDHKHFKIRILYFETNCGGMPIRWEKGLAFIIENQHFINSMKHSIKSIRPFIGAENFELSRQFYQDLGFEESLLGPNLSYFQMEGFGFYLQKAYVRDWVDNSMIFLEVADVQQYWDALLALDLPRKYKTVRLTPIQVYDWGSECFLHDPSGILWHFGAFFEKSKL